MRILLKHCRKYPVKFQLDFRARNFFTMDLRDVDDEIDNEHERHWMPFESCDRFLEPTVNFEKLQRRQIFDLGRSETRFDRIKSKVKEKLRLKKDRNIQSWNLLSEEEKRQHTARRLRSQDDMTKRLDEALQSGINVCVELSFNIGSEKEQKSLSKQLSIGYGIIRKCEKPIHLHVTAFNPLTLTGAVLLSQGISFWRASTHTSSAWEIFPLADIVVLSPDAEEALEDLTPDKVYVIGGIVDRSVRKGCTLALAEQEGLCVRRLPIRENLSSWQSPIMNVDAMIGILCSFNSSRDWAAALHEYMPARRKNAPGCKGNTKLIESEGLLTTMPTTPVILDIAAERAVEAAAPVSDCSVTERTEKAPPPPHCSDESP